MADSASSTEYPVYTGVWINWSRGRIAGATITLNHRNGALLTAFLAIFVTFVGTSFWRIASFTLHQSLSSERPKDGLYHQTQAVLKNSGNGTISLARLLGVLWAWRYKATRPFYRTIPLIMATVICISAFAVASILSSKVSSGIDNEVLISSNLCGRPSYGDPNTTSLALMETVMNPWMARKMNSYATYVQNCYTNISKAADCSSFIKRQLTSTVDRNAPCPFGPKICRNQHQNIKIDSGYLHFDSDLGLNVPPNLRYTYRVTTQCAPLTTEGFKTVFNDSSDVDYMKYWYGYRNDNSLDLTFNYTYEYQIPSVTRILSENVSTGWADYSLG